MEENKDSRANRITAPPIMGFEIKVFENPALEDGKAVMMLSSNDYRIYKENLEKGPQETP